MSVELAETDVEMPPETIGVTPLALTIGAEITGVDLTRPLPEPQVREVWAALLKWKAVFFRDQHLDHAQHVAFSRQFGALTPTESNRLLAMLKEHAARPEFTVRFKWTSGSVAMWDNRSTTHMGPRDIINTGHAREVHRTTLMGDIPVGVDGRAFTPIEASRSGRFEERGLAAGIPEIFS